MSSNHIGAKISVILSTFAILIAAWAGWTAYQAQISARSSIEVMEHNTLTTPVFDEGDKKWGFLAIYELSLTNTGSYDVTLESVDKVKDGSGFLIFLNQGQISSLKIEHGEFIVKPTIAEIKHDPKLLKSLGERELRNSTPINLKIEKGKSKFIRLGIMCSPYKPSKELMVDSALLSLQLVFSHGKSEFFRRAFRIVPLPTGKNAK